MTILPFPIVFTATHPCVRCGVFISLHDAVCMVDENDRECWAHEDRDECKAALS
jgi:hypothetical protein